MNSTGIGRRTFVAGMIAAAATPAFARAGSGIKRNRRVLLDTTNRIPLPGVKLRVSNLSSGKMVRLRSDANGFWDFSQITDQVRDPAGVWFRLDIDPILVGDISYAGIRHWFRIVPGGPGVVGNRAQGRISLVPLSRPGITLGVDDEELASAWPTLLRETLFAVERPDGSLPAHLARGAVTRFRHSRPAILLGSSLSTAEQGFVADVLQEALPTLSEAAIAAGDMLTIPLEEEPFFGAGNLSGALVIAKRVHFTKPVTCLRYDAGAPYAIDAAGIYLDRFTLDGLYRNGAGSPDEIDLARHVIQRAGAEALGYRPTLSLPGRTVLDATIGPGLMNQRSGLSPEDLLLARVLYGSGWIQPGTRLNTDGTILESPRPTGN